MVQYAEECRTLGIPFIFDPGQQCARMSGEELRDGLVGARVVICNDYEFELIRQKTGLDEADVLERAGAAGHHQGRARLSILDGATAGGRAGGAAARGSSIRPASATRSAAAS